MRARLSRKSTPSELASEFAMFMRELVEAGVDEIRDANFYFTPHNDGEPVFFQDKDDRRHDMLDVAHAVMLRSGRHR